jgi:hypothetical protein
MLCMIILTTTERVIAREYAGIVARSEMKDLYDLSISELSAQPEKTRRNEDLEPRPFSR